MNDSAMTMKKEKGKKVFSLVWFRVGDLRIHDHEPLTYACVERDLVEKTVIPFVVLNTVSHRDMSVYRREAIQRAVICLGQTMERHGSRLIVLHDDWRVGLRAIVDYVMEQKGCGELNLHYYMSPHECIDPHGYREQQAMLEEISQYSPAITCHRYWGRTLFHPEDMQRGWDHDTHGGGDSLKTWYPGSLNIIQSCENMTRFRNACQGVIPVRAPFSIPDISLYSKEIDGVWSALTEYRRGHMLDENGKRIELRDDIPVVESEAHKHLHTILCDAEYMAAYRTSRMSASTSHTGAMLSTALSLGTISPRTVYESIQQRMCQRDESWTWKSKVHASSPGEEWLLMHLVIRDFFLYSSELEAENIGTFGDDLVWSNNMDHFDRWKNGQTGYPFVDASMREIASTGFMSNRARQNVASFLTKAINIDWRWGASYFANMLIDHEPGVNIESWAYIAGVGPGRRDSKFLTVTQGEKYDPDATCISKWIPELHQADTQQKHRPWLLSDTSIISSYPQPMIPDTSSQCRQ